MNKVLEKNTNNSYQALDQNSMFNNGSYFEPNYNQEYQQPNYMYNQNQFVNYDYSMYNGQYEQNPSYSYMNNGNQCAMETEQSDYYYAQDQRGYVRPTQQYNQYNQVAKTQEVKNKKKTKYNGKAKLLIGVYFFIVAVIATLLLINMTVGGTAIVNADGDEFVSINEEALNYAIDADGNVVALESQEATNSYSYELDDNWFDNMCDALSSKVGN